MTLQTPAPTPTRAAIVALARRWIGTPYLHQASREGVGSDCIGLVRGIYRALHGCEPLCLPAYTRDWAEATGAEHLLDAARCHLIEIAPECARPGDILVFRYRASAVAKHAAILASTATQPAALTLIHAMEGAAVVEVPFQSWWRRRVAAAFAFPGIID